MGSSPGRISLESDTLAVEGSFMDGGVSTRAKLLFTVRLCLRPTEILLVNSEGCGGSLPGPFVPQEKLGHQLLR